MKTWEAIKAMQDGERVRRLCWRSDAYIASNGGIIFDDLGSDFAVTSLKDVGDDAWVLYEQQGHDFSWAVEQMKAGKTVMRKADGYKYRTNSLGYVVWAGADSFNQDVAFEVNEFEATDWILA